MGPLLPPTQVANPRWLLLLVQPLLFEQVLLLLLLPQAAPNYAPLL
jgi:hypothetical protein